MVTMERILCATDFSENAEPVVQAAVAMARHYGARLRLVHVSAPIPVVPLYNEVAIDTRWFELQRQHEADQLMAAADRARRDDLTVDVDHRDGAAAAEILDAAREFDANLVVVGTHGRSGFDRFALGSVAEKVLRKAICPVVTVPPSAAPLNAGATFARVLCAYDGSLEAQHAAHYAVSLVRDTPGAVTLLRVVEPIPAFDGIGAVDVESYRRQWEDDAARSLRDLLSPAERQGCRIEERVRYGRPRDQILSVATELRADLIVMGVRGRGTVDLLVFGSTTNHVVRRAPCPVLTVHPPPPSHRRGAAA